MDGDIKELTTEVIAGMDENALIERAIDAFDYDPLVRAPILALMRVRARKLGIDDLLGKLIEQYEGAERKNSVQYAKEIAARNTPVQLEYDARGQPLKTIDNFLRVMRGDPFYRDVKYNLLKKAAEIDDVDGIRVWTDADSSNSRWFIEAQYGIHNKEKHRDAMNKMLQERAYHPVRDLIEAIRWDGQERIESFLPKWMKCEDTPYTREVSRLIFAGGIHRVYNPGCKFDDMPVMIGTAQGEGKSTMTRWLAVEDRFYREITEIEGQKGMEAIDGAWICEVGELLALTKVKEQEAVKSYISRQVDVFRKSYGEFVGEYPRQCVFIGTTNRAQFLADKTGGRRFFPVIVHSSGYDLYDHEEEIRAEILQCWAEALVRMRAGKMPPFADKELTAQIKAEQEEAQEDDYRVGLIAKYLRGKDQVCGIELWEYALNNQFVKPTPRDFMDIRLIMQGMKSWERSKVAPRLEKYGKQRVWVRKKIAIEHGQSLLFSDVTDDEDDMEQDCSESVPKKT